MSFAKYPQYKASGVDWLGDVPQHWAIKPLKHNLRFLTEKTDRQDNPVALENIEGWTGRLIPTETEFQGEGIGFAAGDILFGKLRPYLAKVYLAEAPGAAVGDFHVLRPAPGVDGRFTQYEMLSRAFIDTVDSSTFGSRMPRASWEFVGGIKVATPPYDEQTEIAAFLDRETAKIDALVAEQERLIELLKEKRQAVVSHAVTKGIDPGARMKDSGVPWLGRIPAHWGVGQSRRLFSLRNEKARTGDQQLTASQDHGILTQAEFIRLEGRRVMEVIKGADVLKHVEPGDFVISMRSFQGGLEWSQTTGCISSAYVMLRPSPHVHGPYFAFLFKSQPYIQALQSTTNLVRDGQALRYGNFTQVDLPIVPWDDQVAIATYLSVTLSKMNTLLIESQRAVELLRERRSALVSAAVSGQIDVRGLVNPEAA